MVDILRPFYDTMHPLARGLTQAQAAALLGVTQPRVSDLVRGKIDRFSVDILVAMLGHAGVDVRIVGGRSRVA